MQIFPYFLVVQTYKFSLKNERKKGNYVKLRGSQLGRVKGNGVEQSRSRDLADEVNRPPLTTMVP